MQTVFSMARGAAVRLFLLSLLDSAALAVDWARNVPMLRLRNALSDAAMLLDTEPSDREEELEKELEEVRKECAKLDAALRHEKKKCDGLEKRLVRSCEDCVRADAPYSTPPCNTCMFNAKHPRWESRKEEENGDG
jgi:septal ring factor EnvC (AmiA/AmiB activator)